MSLTHSQATLLRYLNEQHENGEIRPVLAAELRKAGHAVPTASSLARRRLVTRKAANGRVTYAISLAGRVALGNHYRAQAGVDQYEPHPYQAAERVGDAATYDSQGRLVCFICGQPSTARTHTDRPIAAGAL